MNNVFKKGLILGGLLAAGAVVGLAMKRGGDQLAEELQDDFKALSKNLKKKLNQVQDITKEGFDEAILKVVEAYAEKKELAVDAKNSLMGALQATWQDMEDEYEAEKKESHQK